MCYAKMGGIFRMYSRGGNWKKRSRDNFSSFGCLKVWHGDSFPIDGIYAYPEEMPKHVERDKKVADVDEAELRRCVEEAILDIATQMEEGRNFVPVEIIVG